MATLIGIGFFCRQEVKGAESDFILAKTGYATWDCEQDGESGGINYLTAERFR